MNLSFIFLIFTLFTYRFHSIKSQSIPSNSLDVFLQDSAFKTLVHHHMPNTGALFKATLPANTSGIKVSVLSLRSKRLWQKGTNFSHFSIPSRTMTVPHVKRLAIVYQDLGNWSFYCYPLQGFSLLTSVVGFLVFDASDIPSESVKKLSLDTMGKPIKISFPNLTFPYGMRSSTRCVEFWANGSFHLSEVRLDGVCYSATQGHFAVVVPTEKKHKVWYLWVIGFVLGISGVVVVGYAGIVSVRVLKTKKIQVMEKQADEDLVLESRWIGGSKMPSAAVTRTMPVIESANF